MINMSEVFELLATGAITTYQGNVDVMVDRPRGLVIIGQGERILVLSFEQAADLIQVLIYKMGEKLAES